ncbi:Transcriptional regulator [Ignavibacterium album JCM 16511]|uniref:Transcriptional regulator n=1 Tax=Ignavibacterium album (strain DSM 19864 / JCM 16511 / NBRC 101810 / Mat9-16) TaxID=945713 RepID=I0AG90_IGNAJ|nr:sigma 54-interacting transcriptional regulator [Ignavibacterium album]AFH47997.1 Transcriptional regulator [Ignavibacterium album JCM 16511]
MLKLFLLLPAIALLTFFPSLNQSINFTTESVIKNILPEKLPDSSIILIKITSEDIEKIGPWPVKRSYYALLIRNLKSLGVRKIGLEVFLSARITSQTVYDNLLESEISNAGNVVLSSIAGEIYKRNGVYFTDSLSFPTPKLLNESFETGHINFIGSKEIIVPSELISFNQVEKAFSVKLSDKTPADKNIIINFVSSWNKFKSYSLLEFFDLINQQDEAEKIFRNKIVLIGVTDNQIAPQFSSPFDDELPGLALHAFATDNLLNERYFRDDLKTFSSFVFVLLILLMIYLTERYKDKSAIIFLLFFIGFIIIVFVVQEILYQRLNASFFLIGFAFTAIAQLIQLYFESKEELNISEKEKELLKSLLQKKEEELTSLKKQSEGLSRDKSDILKSEIEKLQEEINRLRENKEDLAEADEIKESEAKIFFGMAYRSRQMNEVVELIKKAAPTDSTILITGESGTGKELVANAIHKLSKRSSEKFVVVNCAALTESLLESELFGYVKGAFTGAISDKQGKFEVADKGTIFLDEIGETSENFQVKLLRVLQSGDIEKVGATTSKKVNVRVIAATNKNLEKLVSEKKFREDLFYRINVININLPPLRERKEDIDIIVDYLLKQSEQKINISIAALKALNEYDWKGNVRELESVIKRAIIFASSEGRNIIQLSDLPEIITKAVRINIEDLVLESLRKKKFSHSAISETAKELGNINRTIVAENFRGYSFKLFVENSFDKNSTIRQIANCDEADVVKRVEQKFNLWIENLKEDINSFSSDDFEKIKSKFASKYKNLPQRFHLYLDEVIKYLLGMKS